MRKKTRSNRITEMGELQLQVFDILCKLGEGTVYEVQDKFPEAEQPRYMTVLTVLRSLEKKGLATHCTEDRTYIYRPRVSLAEVRKGLLQDVLARAFDGSPRDLVAALLDVDAVTPEVLREVRALIMDSEVAEDGS